MPDIPVTPPRRHGALLEQDDAATRRVHVLLEAARAALGQAEGGGGDDAAAAAAHEAADLCSSSGEIARRALALSEQGLQANRRGDVRAALAHLEQACNRSDRTC